MSKYQVEEVLKRQEVKYISQSIPSWTLLVTNLLPFAMSTLISSVLYIANLYLSPFGKNLLQLPGVSLALGWGPLPSEANWWGNTDPPWSYFPRAWVTESRIMCQGVSTEPSREGSGSSQRKSFWVSRPCEVKLGSPILPLLAQEQQSLSE